MMYWHGFCLAFDYTRLNSLNLTTMTNIQQLPTVTCSKKLTIRFFLEDIV